MTKEKAPGMVPRRGGEVRDAVDRYVNACRMAANEAVRLYVNHGDISIDKVTELVKDVCELTRAVADITPYERAALNATLAKKKELGEIFANVMALRGRNAALRGSKVSPFIFDNNDDGTM